MTAPAWIGLLLLAVAFGFPICGFLQSELEERRERKSPLEVAKRARNKKRDDRVAYYMNLGFCYDDAWQKGCADMKRDAEAAEKAGSNP